MNTALLRFAAVTAVAGALSACSSNPKETEEATLPPVQASSFELVETSRGPRLTLEDVLFDFEEATLRAEATPVVRRAAEYLRDNPDRVAVIEGHTDHVGDADYNLWLSRLRAESVREALVANGVDPIRIRHDGYGETRPVASNATAAGRQANRRVEIVFERDGQPPLGASRPGTPKM